MMFSDLIGVPFVDGGRGMSGMDCWGLVMECFKRQGIEVRNYHISAMELLQISRQMSEDEIEWDKLHEPVFGCLVLLKTEPSAWANHVGIYIGNDKFIHAYPMAGVCISTIRRWRSHLVGYYYPRR
ncbi:MAG: NlpC/P60 family protein [Lachnospiraceae bacterium]|nr:NlpC/P60 family protein [Lachnospiraceae bacterium]